MTEERHIHPIFDQMISRQAREESMGQHAMVIWMTGLSGSGKSTIARGLEKQLFDQGFRTMLLDGDNIRSGLNSNLGFNPDDRAENIRRIAEVSRLFVSAGMITICSFISPTVAIRGMARDIIGKDDFYEVFIDTPLEECEKRDVKGLYAKARAGEIAEFTGITSDYEAPESPFLRVETTDKSVDQSVRHLAEHILPLIRAEK